MSDDEKKDGGNGGKDTIHELEKMDIQLQTYEQQCDSVESGIKNMASDPNHLIGDWFAGVGGKPDEITKLCSDNKGIALKCQALVAQLKGALVLKDVTDTYLKEIEDLFESEGFKNMMATTQGLKVLKQGKFQDVLKDDIIKYIEFAGGVAGVGGSFILLFKFGKWGVRKFFPSEEAGANDEPPEIELDPIDGASSEGSILADSSEDLETLSDWEVVSSDLGSIAEEGSSAISAVGSAVGKLIGVIGVLGAIAFVYGIISDAQQDKKTYKTLIEEETKNGTDLKNLQSKLQDTVDKLKNYYAKVLKSFFDNAMLDQNDPNYDKYKDTSKMSLAALATAVNDELKKQQITQQKVTSWVTTFEASLAAMITYAPQYGKGFNPAKVSIKDLDSCVDNAVGTLGYADKTESEMAVNTMKICWVLKYDIDNKTAKTLIGNGVTDAHLAAMKAAYLATTNASNADIAKQTGITEKKK